MNLAISIGKERVALKDVDPKLTFHDVVSRAMSKVASKIQCDRSDIKVFYRGKQKSLDDAIQSIAGKRLSSRIQLKILIPNTTNNTSSSVLEKTALKSSTDNKNSKDSIVSEEPITKIGKLTDEVWCVKSNQEARKLFRKELQGRRQSGSSLLTAFLQYHGKVYVVSTTVPEAGETITPLHVLTPLSQALSVPVHHFHFIRRGKRVPHTCSLYKTTANLPSCTINNDDNNMSSEIETSSEMETASSISKNQQASLSLIKATILNSVEYHDKESALSLLAVYHAELKELQVSSTRLMKHISHRFGDQNRNQLLHKQLSAQCSGTLATLRSMQKSKKLQNNFTKVENKELLVTCIVLAETIQSILEETNK
eukprot:g1750.t1